MGFPQFTMIMAETFQINIYQKTWTPVSSSKGSLVARILSALDIEVEHELNITPLLQFKVPRGDESLNEIKIGRLAEWVYNGTVAFLGIITGPLDKNQSPYVHIKASGLMEILNWAETPWKFRLKSNSPASQVRELLTRNRYFRQNANQHFTGASVTHSTTSGLSIAAATVTSADAWHVILATAGQRASGTLFYHPRGTFTGKALFVGNPTPSALNRVRYEAIEANETDIDVQFRSAKGPASGPATWTDWSASQKRGTPEDQQQLGITTFSPTLNSNPTLNFNWSQLRFILTTANTLISPALRAYEFINDYPFEIGAGSIILATTAKAYAPSFVPHLRAVKAIVDDNKAEMRVTSGFTLHIKPRIGGTVTNRVLFEEGKNLIITRYEEDDNSLSNSLIALGGFDDGLSQLAVETQSTTSQKLYGIRQGRFEAVGTTLATLQTQLTRNLTEIKNPLIAAAGRVVGLPIESFQPGDVVRFRNPFQNVDVSLRTAIKRHTMEDEGEFVEIELDKDPLSFTRDIGRRVPIDEGGLGEADEILRGQDGSSGSSGSGGSSGTAGSSGITISGTSGTSGSSGTSPPSDRRLKKRIEPSTIDALALLRKINVRDFNWRDVKMGTGRMTGLIAQEAYELIPQYVNKPESPDEMWTVFYNYLVPVLIKAIQELDTKINN